MAIKQKDAVYAAFAAAQGQGLEGEAAKDFAVEQVKAGLMTGEISHSTGFTDEAKAKSYAKALISNWLKKDDRLNGGTKYVPSKRRGPQVKDETLKKLLESLKSLKAHDADAELIAKVEAMAQKRREEVQAAKAQSKVQSIEDTMKALADLGIDVDAG